MPCLLSDHYKWCMVSECKNTSIKTPYKLFVRVPSKSNKLLREKWLKLAGRNPRNLGGKSTLYLCEDHFDLPNDMENYMEYQMMGSVPQVRIRSGCLPKKFACKAEQESKTAPEQSKTAPQQSKIAPQQSKTAPEQSETASQQSNKSLQQSKTAPQQSKTAPEQSEETPQQSKAPLLSAKRKQSRKQSRKQNYRYKKYIHRYKKCIVPKCRNSIRNSPDKVFFPVPQGPIRGQWCKVIKKYMISLSQCYYCCEDHFDLEKDTYNLEGYSLQENKSTLRLKKGVVPHKFQCEMDIETESLLVKKPFRRRKIEIEVNGNLSTPAKQSVSEKISTVGNNLDAGSANAIEEEPVVVISNEDVIKKLSSRITTLQKECDDHYHNLFDEFGRTAVETLKSLPLAAGVQAMEKLKKVLSTFKNSHEPSNALDLKDCDIYTGRSSNEKSPVNEASTKQEHSRLLSKELRVNLTRLKSIKYSTDSITNETIRKDPLFLIDTKEISALAPMKPEVKPITSTKAEPENNSMKTSEINPSTKFSLKKINETPSSSTKIVENIKCPIKSNDPEVKSILKDHNYSKPRKIEIKIRKYNTISPVTKLGIKTTNTNNTISKQGPRKDIQHKIKKVIKFSNIFATPLNEPIVKIIPIEQNNCNTSKSPLSKQNKNNKKITTKKAALNKPDQMVNYLTKPKDLDNEINSKISIKQEKNDESNNEEFNLDKPIEYYDYSTDTASSCYDDCDWSNIEETDIICKIEPEEEFIGTDEGDYDYNISSEANTKAEYEDPLAQR